MYGTLNNAELHEFLEHHNLPEGPQGWLVVQPEGMTGSALLRPQSFREDAIFRAKHHRHLPEHVKGIVGGEEVTVLRLYRPGSKAWALRLLTLRAEGVQNDTALPREGREAARAVLLELRRYVYQESDDDLR